ncbi:MAG: hypothetical protein JW717_02670 [Marinilabiliaceae bacterium]|nr:hypothetical protein [Marinilabiliaceae bacterium]
MNRVLSLVLFVFSAIIMNGQVYNIIVDAGGNGNYQTIQEAINAVVDNQTSRTLIFVKNGVYNEKVALPSTKVKVSIIGESVDGVIVTWADEAGSGVISTADTYTFWTDGVDCYLENLTIKNTAGDVGQAVALRTTGDRTIIVNCKLTGFQDTFYAHKNRQYIFKSYVNGGTDFVFGDATAVLDSCKIECLQGGSYISAPADTKLTATVTGEDGNKFTFYKGLQFRNCEIIAGTGVIDNSYYLARPWQPDASSVFINCKMGSHIKPIGWSTWNNDNHLSGFYGEYHSKDLENNILDVSQRADWSHQITDFNYKFYNIYTDPANGVVYAAFYLKVVNNVLYNWAPYDTVKPLNLPIGFSVSGRNIQWQSVNNAIGYIIYRDGNLLGFSNTNSYKDESAALYTPYEYTVRTVKNTGGMSELSDAYLVTFDPAPVKKSAVLNLNISVSNGLLIVTEPANVFVYSMSGQLVKKIFVEKSLDLRSLRGIYLIKATTFKNITALTKVIL